MSYGRQPDFHLFGYPCEVTTTISAKVGDGSVVLRAGEGIVGPVDTDDLTFMPRRCHIDTDTFLRLVDSVLTGKPVTIVNGLGVHSAGNSRIAISYASPNPRYTYKGWA